MKLKRYGKEYEFVTRDVTISPSCTWCHKEIPTGIKGLVEVDHNPSVQLRHKFWYCNFDCIVAQLDNGIHAAEQQIKYRKENREEVHERNFPTGWKIYAGGK